jgi:cytosine/uracil/thiamine/allantoin permease
MESQFAQFSTIAGIAVAVVIFVVAWWLVVRARAGNAKVRETRHDPHAHGNPHSGDPTDARRDIPQ